MGEATANLRYDAIRACPVRLDGLSVELANSLFDQMEQEGRSALGIGARGSARVERSAEMKYVDQIHYCDVQAPAGTMDAAKLARLREIFTGAMKTLHLFGAGQ